MAVRQDADEAASMDAAEAGLSGASSSGVTAVSFSSLYEALGKRLVNERTVLLLYDTLQTCPHFQNYVFVRRYVMICLQLCLQADHPVQHRRLRAMS